MNVQAAAGRARGLPIPADPMPHPADPPQLLDGEADVTLNHAVASNDPNGMLKRGKTMIDPNREQKLARFTDELLKIRVLRGTGEPLTSYLEAATGQELSLERLLSWCSNTETTVRIVIRKSESGYQAEVSRMSAEESQTYKKARAGSRYGFRRLARTLLEGTFWVRVESGRETITFPEFLYWIDKYDLNDIGACNGDWGETQDGALRVLTLTALVPALDTE